MNEISSFFHVAKENKSLINKNVVEGGLSLSGFRVFRIVGRRFSRKIIQRNNSNFKFLLRHFVQEKDYESESVFSLKATSLPFGFE